MSDYLRIPGPPGFFSDSPDTSSFTVRTLFYDPETEYRKDIPASSIVPVLTSNASVNPHYESPYTLRSCTCR